MHQTSNGLVKHSKIHTQFSIHNFFICIWIHCLNSHPRSSFHKKKSCIYLIRLILQKMASNIHKPRLPWFCPDMSILDKRTFLQYIKCRLEIAVSDLLSAALFLEQLMFPSCINMCHWAIYTRMKLYIHP